MMMLRASSMLSPLCRGVKGAISRLILTHSFSNYRNQSASELSLLYPTYGTSGDRIWKHLLHSSSEQDEFSEVDFPQEGTGTRLNLITEEPREFLNLSHSSSEEDGFDELDFPPEGPDMRLNMITERPKASVADLLQDGRGMHSSLITEKPREFLNLSHSSSEEDDFDELDFPPEGPGMRLNMITEKPKASVADLLQECNHSNLITEKPREFVSLLHSSSEDDFSELDLPPEGLGSRPNLITEKSKGSLEALPQGGRSTHLVTEKPREYMESRGKKKKKSKGKSSPLKKGSNSSEKKIQPKTICFVAENHTGSRMEKDVENSPIHTNSNLVIIEQIPTTFDLNQLRKALSVFGDILNASVRANSAVYNSLYVEFKTSISKERAVASRAIVVDSCFLPIRNLCLPEKITIRISNITSNTAEPAIHSACMRCGPVEKLLRTSNSSVDVVFSVKDFSGGEDTVEKLNFICTERRWSAEILKEQEELTGKEISTDASQVERDAGLELSNILDDVEKQFQLKKILIDDLVKLHGTVLHLQNRPVS